MLAVAEGGWRREGGGGREAGFRLRWSGQDKKKSCRDKT